MTLHTPPAFDALLVAAPPKVSAEQAQAVAAQYFGLHGACRLLTGERDLNFQITCADGAQYLLKVSNAAEDPQVADFQNQALLHIQHCDPTLAVQRIYPNTSGSYQIPLMFDGQPLPSHRAPHLGADSDAVLAELGYSEDEIIDLEAQSDDLTGRWKSEKEKVGQGAQLRETLDRLATELLEKETLDHLQLAEIFANVKKLPERPQWLSSTGRPLPNIPPVKMPAKPPIEAAALATSKG